MIQEQSVNRWPRIAAGVMAGKRSSEIGFTERSCVANYTASEAVSRYAKFPGVDPEILGPGNEIHR